MHVRIMFHGPNSIDEIKQLDLDILPAVNDDISVLAPNQGYQDCRVEGIKWNVADKNPEVEITVAPV